MEGFPGPCTFAFLWFTLVPFRIVAGDSVDLPDCNPKFPSGNGWVVHFPGIIVPPLPGPALALGIVTHSDGTRSVDREQFEIVE